MPSSREVYPSTLPATLAQGHGFTPMANGRQRERDQGEKRIRPRFRNAPESASVVWIYTQAQFDLFHAWFEDDLLVGSQRFDLQLHQRGGVQGATWYVAQFVDDYQAQVLEGLRYQVTAQLLLLEELGPIRVAPGIELGGGVAFGGGAILTPFVLRVAGNGLRFGGALTFAPQQMQVSGLGVRTDGSAAFPAPQIQLAGLGVRADGNAAFPAPEIEVAGLGVQFAGSADGI